MPRGIVYTCIPLGSELCCIQLLFIIIIIILVKKKELELKKLKNTKSKLCYTPSISNNWYKILEGGCKYKAKLSLLEYHSLAKRFMQ